MLSCPRPLQYHVNFQEMYRNMLIQKHHLRARIVFLSKKQGPRNTYDDEIMKLHFSLDMLEKIEEKSIVEYQQIEPEYFI